MGCQRPILPVQPLQIPHSPVYSLQSFSFFWGSDRIAIESDPSLLWLLSGDFHAQLMFMTSDCVAAITHWKSRGIRGESGRRRMPIERNLWTLGRTRSRSIDRSTSRSHGDRLNHARNHLNENVAARKLATVFFFFAIWIYVHRRYLTCENQSLIDATTDFHFIPSFPPSGWILKSQLEIHISHLRGFF